MGQWVEKLDDFLRFNEKEILQNKGLISRQDMETKVREELQRFNENTAVLEAGDE
jgi:hypothetical protein